MRSIGFSALLLTVGAGVAPPSSARGHHAIVSATETSLRTAPFLVAPLRRVLKRGERLQVSKAPSDGWRFAAFSNGVQGYVRDADLSIEAPSPSPVTNAALPTDGPSPPPPPVKDNGWSF